MLLAVEAHVVSASSVLFLLLRIIGTAEVIGVLGSPLLVAFLLLLAATFGLATGLLPLAEPRVRVIPTMTERTPPSRGHTLLLQPSIFRRNRTNGQVILRKVMWSDSEQNRQIIGDPTAAFTFLMSHH